MFLGTVVRGLGIIYYINLVGKVMPKNIDINFDYNAEVKKCKTIDDVIGKNGFNQYRTWELR